MITRRRPSLYQSVMCLAVLAVIPACSFATVHLTGLKVGKDRALTTETSTFASTDTVYAQAGVANSPGKVTLRWHVIAEHVTGQPANTTIPNLGTSYDLEGDGTGLYGLTAPTAGWPTGTYRIEVDMMVDGQQKDQKTAEFTVAPS